MSIQVKRRRESASFLATYVGAQGELLVDTTNNRVQVHDGATPGGFPAAKLAEVPGLAPVQSVAGRTGAVALAIANVSGAAAFVNAAIAAATTTPLATIAQSPSGAALQAGVLEQLITLSGAATTSTIQIPNRAIVLCVGSLTVATVTGAPSYGVGVAGNATQFGGSLGASAGSTNAGVIGPTAFYAPTPLVITATSGSFTGGQVRVAIHYLLCGVPTS